MKIIKLDTNDKTIMSKLMPLYFDYEVSITNLKVEEMFNVNEPLENETYFYNYFNRGIDTLIYQNQGTMIGFISFNIDSDDVPGYAKNYRGFGHLAEIYINKSNRQNGIGRVLVEKFENLMISNNIKKVYLVDLANNHSFWIKLGYINTHQVEPNEGGIIFVKDLILI